MKPATRVVNRLRNQRRLTRLRPRRQKRRRERARRRPLPRPPHPSRDFLCRKRNNFIRCCLRSNFQRSKYRMAEITAAAVGKLREMTNAGLMDCKRALTEANGDLNAAVDILRKRGVATAAKKSSREAREGLITQCILPGSRIGVLVEVNCETDFVAKNDTFRAFCDEVARQLAGDPQADLEPERVAAVARLGENIRISRQQRFEVNGNGMVAAYIHTGGKVGVLVEVGAGNESTVANDEFKQLV